MERNGETAHIISQVATIDGKIRELRVERATLLQKLNHIRSSLVSRLPSEVLSHIFWFAIRPYEWDGPREPRPSDTKALFQLRTVCVHWRRVTQSSPQLWSNLALAKKWSDARMRATNYTALVKHYCQHSGPAAMSVYISDLPLPSTTIDTIMEIFLKENPGKLRALHLREKTFWPAIFKYARENVEFTQLEELDLHWSRVHMTGSQSREMFLFRNSPRLRSLSLSGNGNTKIPLKFPWSQLTTLDLSGTSLKYSFRILGLCPNLINCKISYHYANDGSSGPAQREIVSMQSVRRLTWALWYSSGLYSSATTNGKPKPVDSTFFAQFRFPAVRKLKWNAPLPSEAPSVRSFFGSMQELVKLEFSPSRSEWQYCIDQHLDVFVSLTTLEADFTGLEEEMPKWLYRLTIKRGKDNLFPHLQTLHLTMDDVEPHELIVVLHSRRNGPVDWSDPGQNPVELTLAPYDPSSTHWQHHTRLLDFSIQYDVRGGDLDWTLSPLYDALEDMIEEAKEVEGFGECDNGLCRILF